MTTNTELAALLSEATDRLGEGAQRLETHENALFNRFDSILSSQEPTIFIDQANGDDGANGAEAAPVKTLTKAVSMVPKGGIGLLRITGDYNFSENVNCAGKIIILFGTDPANKPFLTFQQYVEPNSGSGIRRVYGFVGHDCHIIIRSCRIIMPVAAGGATSSAVANSASGVIARTSSHLVRLAVSLFDVELDFAETPYVSLIGAGGGLVDLYVASSAVVGSSMNGKWVQSIAANADPNTISRIRTNLTSL